MLWIGEIGDSSASSATLEVWVLCLILIGGAIQSNLQDMASSEPNIRSPQELATLLRDLDGEIERVLVEEGVFSVEAYGWLDHDIPDPDYSGHNVWQTNPPFEPDFSAMMNGEVVTYAPATRDEVLTRNGEDFVAVMIAARRSMGMALMRARSVQSVANSDEFWQEYSTCTMLLAIASDRIRDFLVMAVENTEYDSQKSEKSQHSVVMQAIGNVPGLAALAIQSQNFKKVRNDIVHKLATLPARRMVNSLNEQKAQAISGRPVEIWEPTIEEWEAVMADSQGPTINAEIEQMKSWHACLIEASNLVFEAENIIRRK